MAEEFTIETKGLKKIFVSKVKGKKNEVAAVRGVDLRVKKGEIFGFLGPNGAGKSTTQKMLSTLLVPTSGFAKIAGFDLKNQQIGTDGQPAVSPRPPKIDCVSTAACGCSAEVRTALRF